MSFSRELPFFGCKRDARLTPPNFLEPCKLSPIAGPANDSDASSCPKMVLAVSRFLLFGWVFQLQVQRGATQRTNHSWFHKRTPSSVSFSPVSWSEAHHFGILSGAK